MNETFDQLWVNRPRFSTEFAAEAQLLRRPITRSYERFDNSREGMSIFLIRSDLLHISRKKLLMISMREKGEQVITSLRGYKRRVTRALGLMRMRCVITELLMA